MRVSFGKKNRNDKCDLKFANEVDLDWITHELVWSKIRERIYLAVGGLRRMHDDKVDSTKTTRPRGECSLLFSSELENDTLQFIQGCIEIHINQPK